MIIGPKMLPLEHTQRFSKIWPSFQSDMIHFPTDSRFDQDKDPD